MGSPDPGSQVVRQVVELVWWGPVGVESRSVPSSSPGLVSRFYSWSTAPDSIRRTSTRSTPTASGNSRSISAS